VIAATILSSSITMGRSLTMEHGVFAAH